MEGIEDLYNSYTAKVGFLINIFGLNIFFSSLRMVLVFDGYGYTSAAKERKVFWEVTPELNARKSNWLVSPTLSLLLWSFKKPTTNQLEDQV